MAASQLRAARPAQLLAMDPRDLADTVAIVRRLQLSIIREHNVRNRRRPSLEGQQACTGGLLLGSLIAALGFDPIANDPEELEAGVGAEACRRYIGLA